MKKVFVKIRKALKKDGILYLSFKYGEEECFCDGRFFNYYTEKSFTELIAKVSGLEIIELWKTIDAKENRKDTFWLNVLIIKE